ncbi:MAG: hypothetical protein Q8916_15095 [Bacteroidota bacterium]|nr:hypothetical protein [Bacteroidota bacterium]MDP4236597.1 hypothetical protein [Bacteroidota bacterium]
MTEIRQPKINLQYIATICIAVFLTFVSHEFVHYLTGEILGNTMTMNLNEAYPVSGSYLQDWHFSVVTATAPLFTILQAVVFFAILRRKNLPMLFPFLFTPVLLRCLAMGLSISNPNDEARLSRDAGLSLWTLPAIVCLFLIYLLYRIIKVNGYEKKFVIWSLVLGLTFISILILANQYFLR